MHRRVTEAQGASPLTIPWETLAAALIVLAALALLITLIARRRGGPSEADNAEVLENLDGQIMALLHQSGGDMTQAEICQALGAPLQAVTSMLHDMEERGWVTRRWVAERYTFRVSV